jgi:hypothetical protein
VTGFPAVSTDLGVVGGELFVNFDEEYDALEDAGDVLLEHLIRYTLDHPDEFSAYDPQPTQDEPRST